MWLNIIHLPRRNDRYEHLLGQLAIQDIKEFQFWDGIEDSEFPQRGIRSAHQRIIQNALDKQLETVLIAEDDLLFTAPGAFKYFMKNIPSSFDLYLGGISDGKIQNDGSTNSFSGLMLYMVHRRFYEVMLSFGGDQHLDTALRGLGKFYVCDPMVAMQQNGYSDNQKRHIEYDVFFKGRNLFT
jgi:hypothetical protein